MKPVAWLENAPWGVSVSLDKPDYGKATWKAPAPTSTPLYARPEPLSDVDILALYGKWDATPGASYADLIRSVERRIWGDES